MFYSCKLSLDLRILHRYFRKCFSGYSLGYAFLVLVIFASASCANKQTVIKPAKEYYDNAVVFMDKKQYQASIEEFDQLQIFHPLSPYARVSELEKIAANYGFGAYEETAYLAQRFIDFYPDSSQLDFAYYMKGRAEYAQGVVLIDRFNERQLDASKTAYDTFSQLVVAFPDSQYFAESHAHMRHIRNILAHDEIITARYYFKRFSYVAAINRCVNILQNFPGTPYNLEALSIMEAAYLKLGWDEQAAEVAEVYKNNAGLYE